MTAPDGFRIDPRAARRAFSRAAGLDPRQDVLGREVERRMAERLDLVRLAPTRILDAGAGAGASVDRLRARFPRADLYALDMNWAALGGIAKPRSTRALDWMRGIAPVRALCGDLSVLPLQDACMGMIWSNLALNWADDLPATFREWHRVLVLDGLLMFSAFGPDTLRELRSAGAAVHAFVDMHDVGDMLVTAGFAEPVMDMERITLTYADLHALVRDLRATGQTNVLAARGRGLRGRAYWDRVVARYEQQRRDGRLPATVEIIYGHAWKATPRLRDDGRSIIRFDPTARPRSSHGPD